MSDFYDRTISVLRQFMEAKTALDGKIGPTGSQDSEAMFDKLQEEVAFYCGQEKKSDIVVRAFDKCKEEITNCTTPKEAELIMQKFEAAKYDNIDGKKDSRYKEFLEFRAAHSSQGAGSVTNSDETIMFVQSTQNLIDPISRMRMTDPVKNSCGHTYDKSSVLELLSRNKSGRIPCIYGGCPTIIERKNLTPNYEIRRLLELAGDESVADEGSHIIALDASITND